MLETYEIIILILFLIATVLSTIYLVVLIKYAIKCKQEYKAKIKKVFPVKKLVIYFNNEEIEASKVEYNALLNEYFAIKELERKIEKVASISGPLCPTKQKF